MSSNSVTKNVSFLKNPNNRDLSAYSNTFFCQDWWITRKPGLKTLGTYVTREFKSFDCVVGTSQMVKKSKKGHKFFLLLFWCYSAVAKSYHYQNRQIFRMLCYPCKSHHIHFIVLLGDLMCLSWSKLSSDYLLQRAWFHKFSKSYNKNNEISEK